MAAGKPIDEKTIDELQDDLTQLDAAMASLRAQKEDIIAELRRLQRVRDAITEPLERKLAIERMTSGKPATEIGL